jgi:hypothetical protein
MSRYAITSRCPHCKEKYAIKFDYYQVKGFLSEQYLGVCQHCSYIPSLRRFRDGSRQQKGARP